MVPIINVKMVEGRSNEQKRELVGVFTREMVRILDVNPEWIIIIDEYSRDNWGSTGHLHSYAFGKGFDRQGT